MRPLVFELIEDIDVAEGAEDAAHETRFAHCTLDRVKTGADCALRTDYAGDTCCDFAEHVVCACDCFLACCDGVSYLLG